MAFGYRRNVVAPTPLWFNGGWEARPRRTVHGWECRVSSRLGTGFGRSHEWKAAAVKLPGRRWWWRTFVRLTGSLSRDDGPVVSSGCLVPGVYSLLVAQRASRSPLVHSAHGAGRFDSRLDRDSA